MSSECYIETWRSCQKTIKSCNQRLWRNRAWRQKTKQLKTERNRAGKETKSVTSRWSFLFSALSSSSTFSAFSAAFLYLATWPSSRPICKPKQDKKNILKCSTWSSPATSCPSKDTVEKIQKVKELSRERRVGIQKIKNWETHGMKNESGKLKSRNCMKRCIERTLNCYQGMMKEVLSPSTEFSSKERMWDKSWLQPADVKNYWLDFLCTAPYYPKST